MWPLLLNHGGWLLRVGSFIQCAIVAEMRIRDHSDNWLRLVADTRDLGPTPTQETHVGRSPAIGVFATDNAVIPYVVVVRA